MFNYYKKNKPLFLAKDFAGELSEFPKQVSTKKSTSYGHDISDFPG